ncbi:MAG: phosphatidate cytidylyltransferase [Sandaracinaceae bacterium]|nr:phosphatidate cytidylyltransferase [Sandaracinaceae bacterium]
MGWLIAGPLYVGVAVGALAKLHHLDNGGTWVVLSMALAWGSDTGGYFAGRAFGRHKLYEKISPKKTVEGSIGGLAAVVAFALAMRALWIPELPWAHAVVLALVAGAVGQAGDLCISVIKRSMGVKDSGHIIPGHGGLLDRIDALMFTAIVTLLYAEWVLALPSRIPSFDFAS